MTKYYIKINQLIILATAVLLLLSSIVYAADNSGANIQISISQYHKIKNNLQKIDPTTAPDQSLALKKDKLSKINDIYNLTLISQKENLISFQSLDQPTKDSLSLILQTAIDKLNSNAAAIPNLKPEDLANAAKILTDLWLSTQAQYDKSLGSSLNEKEAAVTSSLEEQINQLQLRSATLKANNKDVSKIDAQILQSQKSLSNLKQNNILCQSKFNTISPVSDPNLTFQDAATCINNSQKNATLIWQNINSITPEIDKISKSTNS